MRRRVINWCAIRRPVCPSGGGRGPGRSCRAEWGSPRPMGRGHRGAALQDTVNTAFGRVEGKKGEVIPRLVGW